MTAASKDRRSPKPNGVNVGEGLNGGIGDGSFPPEPIGEGGFGTRVEIAE